MTLGRNSSYLAGFSIFRCLSVLSATPQTGGNGQGIQYRRDSIFSWFYEKVHSVGSQKKKRKKKKKKKKKKTFPSSIKTKAAIKFLIFFFFLLKISLALKGLTVSLLYTYMKYINSFFNNVIYTDKLKITKMQFQYQQKYLNQITICFGLETYLSLS